MVSNPGGNVPHLVRRKVHVRPTLQLPLPFFKKGRFGFKCWVERTPKLGVISFSIIINHWDTL